MQSRIARAAEELFIAKGFEETTVDEIAAAVGMSQRSFFRYFASKDEVVLDNLERLGEELAETLEARPAEEPEWDSLRRSFDPVVERLLDPAMREHDKALHRIVDTSPRLFAAYLGRLDRLQRSLAEHLVARAAGSGREPDELVLRAMVGCAFACLHAAMLQSAAEPEDFGRSLDRAMAALRPAQV
ncbi:TetR/AcrR family transcriptional regulator [Glycomyces sp. TRM65418]|uniref:TetR/AcrR family transcriptional regulator n=1 Tax=Glycomyces sp. TRM65418 TaxID=2867006 RepID=UPI001CE683D0|nr:TetR/AcrR family transcriptional regulator [Glycomyces sp. TRM65418]MCC3763376.1 TetR/AcrR family transcriptional regulator [Glycomyces sp. TRM65418]QZD57367.1 TetR/AcrR family transcriptional regulator [Glycomyces sp. TRM65418]